MHDHAVACRHLAQFFQIAIEYNMDEVDFVIKALNSEYKDGIESYIPQWYSQSKYYYFEEFMEDNEVKHREYKEEDIFYEKERMYWLGYCLQAWSNKTTLRGTDIAKLYGEDGIEHLLKHYKIYHTVDPLYVLEDTIEINELDVNFDEILKDEFK